MTDQSTLTRELDQKMVGPVVPDTALPVGRRYLPLDTRKLLPSGQRREHELRTQTATPEVDTTHVTRRMEDLEAQHPHVDVVSTAPPGAGPYWYDYLVDPLYTGTEGATFTTLHGSTFIVYSNLTDAMAAAITAASTSLKKTILVVGNIGENSIDIAGMGTSAVIVIYGSDRYDTLISGPAGGDIFIQTASGGSGTGGRLLFRNIGLAPQSGYAVLYPTHNSSVTRLEFEDCNFTQSGGYLVRQTGTTNLGGMSLTTTRCTGTLAGFYNIAGPSSAVAPNSLEAFDNNLTMARWWNIDGTNSSPDFTRVQGGYYEITTGGIAFSNSANHQHWSSLNILYGGSQALFSSSTTSIASEDWTFQNIIIETEVAGGRFADFQTSGASPHKRIFIESIYGFSSATPSGIFVNIDPNITDVYAGDIHAPQWPTVYAGPPITPAVPPVVDASDVTFIPGTLADWIGSADPGNVDDALDQLAGLVFTAADARTAVPYIVSFSFGYDPKTPQVFAPA